MQATVPSATRHRLALAALFLSGAAGLVHEVAWAKLLARWIGSTAHAQALVLALFMGGLAIGAVRYGRRARAGAEGLRLYARLELLIAGSGLLLPVLGIGAAMLHDAAGSLTFGRPAVAFTLRFLLAALVALPPAIFMGGTLPVLAACLTRQASETRHRVGALYAVNNLGAVLGALVAGFFLVARFGVLGALCFAAALNVASALLGFALARRETAEPAEPPTARETRLEPALSPRAGRVALLVLALSGYAAMGYEAVFTRLISLAFGGTTYSFTVMLAAFITGIAVGSAVIARVRLRRPMVLLGTLQLAAGCAFLAVTPALSRLPYWSGLLRADLQDAPFGFGLYQLGKAGLCLLVLLLPTACLGASFPLVAALQVRAVEAVGSTVGRTYAWNTAGNVLGVLVTGLVVLPAWGLGAAFQSCVAVSFVAGLLALGAAEGRLLRRAAPVAVAAAVAALHLFFGMAWLTPLQHSVDHLRLRSRGLEGRGASWGAAPASSFGAWKQAFVRDPARWDVSYFAEDANANVLALGDGSTALLVVNTKPDASVRLVGSDLSTQELLAHLPALLARERRRALVIGHGSGVTAGSLLQHPFERVDVVEISPAVLGAHRVFAPFNHDALADDRVEVFAEDGRSFLRTVPRRYDVITSEPSNPWLAGIGALFTVEFFRDARERLEPGGVFCAWIHETEQDRASVELVLRTLASVFPSVSVHRATPTGSDLILLGRLEAEAPDFERLEGRFDERPVQADLARVGAFNLVSILASESAGPERLAALLPEGPVNRELHERLEYRAPEAAFRGTRADWVRRHDVLLQPERTGSPSLLDRYLAWRLAQSEPVSRAELRVALELAGEELPPEHPLRVALERRVAEQPALEATSGRPSRRSLPPPASVGFDLAYQIAARHHSVAEAGRALPYYRRAAELRPQDANVAGNLAKVLVALERREEAESVLTAGLRASPGSLELTRELAAVKVGLGRSPEALRLLEGLVARTPDPTALTMLGTLQELGGRPDQALGSYLRAFDLSGDEYWPAVLRLAPLLQRSGRGDEARALVERALVRTPGEARLRALASELGGG